jgi:hypothetical protein
VSTSKPFERLRRHLPRAKQFLGGVATREPGLFVDWRFGMQPVAG